MDVTELIWNLKQLIRSGFPQGLAASELELQYKKYFQNQLPLPSPASVEPGCKNWAQVFRRSTRFCKWFSINQDKMIKVRPIPEADLKAYFLHVRYTQYIAARQGAKIEDVADLSESDSGEEDEDMRFVRQIHKGGGGPDDGERDVETATTTGSVPATATQAEPPPVLPPPPSPPRKSRQRHDYGTSSMPSASSVAESSGFGSGAGSLLDVDVEPDDTDSTAGSLSLTTTTSALDLDPVPVLDRDDDDSWIAPSIRLFDDLARVYYLAWDKDYSGAVNLVLRLNDLLIPIKESLVWGHYASHSEYAEVLGKSLAEFILKEPEEDAERVSKLKAAFDKMGTIYADELHQIEYPKPGYVTIE